MSVREKPVVHSDPKIMSGTPVFVGTRVPFQTLLDYLEAGQPLSEFLEDFPTVSREVAVAALVKSLPPAGNSPCGSLPTRAATSLSSQPFGTPGTTSRPSQRLILAPRTNRFSRWPVLKRACF
jgi:uncharacterized protein (DUF433 family)